MFDVIHSGIITRGKVTEKLASMDCQRLLLSLSLVWLSLMTGWLMCLEAVWLNFSDISLSLHQFRESGPVCYISANLNWGILNLAQTGQAAYVRMDSLLRDFFTGSTMRCVTRRKRRRRRLLLLLTWRPRLRVVLTLTQSTWSDPVTCPAAGHSGATSRIALYYNVRPN